MQPLNVLAVISYYLPGYRAGGALRSVANLVSRASERVRFHVICSDRDLGDTQPYPGVNVGEWYDVGKARVSYVPRPWRGLRILPLIRQVQPDVLYLISPFDPQFSCLPIALSRTGLLPRIPTVVAPQGVLGAGALRIRSWKKKPYLAGLRASGLLRNVVWHATCEVERRDIRRWFGEGAKVFVAPNLCELDDSVISRPAKQAGTLRLVYFSRVVPKKNLLGAIRLLRQVEGRVQLDVIGPIEDTAYWDSCQAEARQLPAHVSLNYRGSILPDQVRWTLSQYDAFFFPTFNENFGYAIVDAMSAGCPALISQQTPWRNLRQLGAGWDLDLDDLDGFRAALRELVQMDEPQHARLRQTTAAYGNKVAFDPEAVAKYDDIFLAAVGNRRMAA